MNSTIAGATPTTGVLPLYPHLIPMVAFTGYSRTGKDRAAKVLLEAGYVRHNPGDVIKRQCDGMVREHLGFSAFTEIDDQKTRIRQLLEIWGDTNYEGVMGEYWRSLPAPCVNTRLCRLAELQEWVRRGGVVVRVRRPGVGPATAWDRARQEELEGHVQFDILNNGTPEQLDDMVRALLLDPRGLPPSQSELDARISDLTHSRN
jgi:hypothetical protein